jgi:hypothetical protein
VQSDYPFSLFSGNAVFSRLSTQPLASYQGGF